MKTGKLIYIMMIVSMLFLYACGGGGGGGSENVANEGNNNPDSSVLTVEQAQNVLYAAYAGIGYNKTADVTDNEDLYNVMFNDLNSLAGNFINEIFWKQFICNPIVEAGKLYLLGNTYKYTPTPAGISSAELKVDKLTNVSGSLGGNFTCDFHAKLSVQFDSNGYTYKSVVYKGSATDFEAEIDGSITAKAGGASPSLNSIKIYAHKTLSAAHTGYEVQYNEWNISYAAKNDTVNIYLLPNIGNLLDVNKYPDWRLYTLKGDFDILKNAETKPYYFDMKYGQLDARSKSLGMYIALDGEVSIPGLDGDTVKISCPGTQILNGNYTDLITQMLNGQVKFSDFISRTDDGLWTTGKITMALENGSTTEASIKAAGWASLSAGSVSIAAWEDNDQLVP